MDATNPSWFFQMTESEERSRQKGSISLMVEGIVIAIIATLSPGHRYQQPPLSKLTATMPRGSEDHKQHLLLQSP
jgi:hypothetical protein